MSVRRCVVCDDGDRCELGTPSGVCLPPRPYFLLRTVRRVGVQWVTGPRLESTD